MSRTAKIAAGVLALLFVVALFYWRGLRQRVGQPEPHRQAEQQAQRELTQPAMQSPSDVAAKARLYWAVPNANGQLAPVEIELPLSNDPEQRARQVLNALIVDAPSPQHRTLPLELTLLEFYLLPDGSAVADFSHALATATPSGILTEQMAIQSIVQTLQANVSTIRRLKILIQGQEQETLAGHIDLTGWIELAR